MSEEQAQQMIQRMQILEEYFVDMSQKESTLGAVLREAHSAVESMKAIAAAESEALMPVGMGVYVQSRINPDRKVILNVGAGVAVEKDVVAAMNYLETRITEIGVTLQDVVSKKNSAGQQIEQLREHANHLMQAAQQQGSGNV